MPTYATGGRDRARDAAAGGGFGLLATITSMAAPHVTGAVALLLAEGYGPQGAVDRLLATADHHVGCGLTSGNCAGRLDAARAAAR